MWIITRNNGRLNRNRFDGYSYNNERKSIGAIKLNPLAADGKNNDVIADFVTGIDEAEAQCFLSKIDQAIINGAPLLDLR